MKSLKVALSHMTGPYRSPVAAPSPIPRVQAGSLAAHLAAHPHASELDCDTPRMPSDAARSPLKAMSRAGSIFRAREPTYDMPPAPADTSPPPYQPAGRAGSIFRAQDFGTGGRQGPNVAAAAAAAAVVAGPRGDLGDGEARRKRAAAAALAGSGGALRRR
jgi:hypothetical protein